MVSLPEAADESRRWQRSIQIKNFFILVTISLQAIRKTAITWPY